MPTIKTLPHFTRRTLAALAPSVCPPDIVELGLVDAVVDHAALTWGSFPVHLRAGLVAGIAALEVARRATRASHAAAFDALDRAPGPLHALAKGIKALLVMAYYEQPAVLAQLGYTADAWIADAKRRRLKVLAGARHA